MTDALDSPTAEIDGSVIAFINFDVPFSNCTAHSVTIWGQRFHSVEHAFQYYKYKDIDPALALKIKRAKSAFEARHLSRIKKVDFKEWDKIRVDIMHQLIKAKAMQHKDVREALLNTGDRAIIDKGNIYEDFWGSGLSLRGKNMLGKLWMIVRTEVQ